MSIERMYSYRIINKTARPTLFGVKFIFLLERWDAGKNKYKYMTKRVSRDEFNEMHRGGHIQTHDSYKQELLKTLAISLIIALIVAVVFILSM